MAKKGGIVLNQPFSLLGIQVRKKLSSSQLFFTERAVFLILNIVCHKVKSILRVILDETLILFLSKLRSPQQMPKLGFIP